MFYVDARLEEGAEIALPDGYEERAAYVVEGALACDGRRIEEATMVVAKVASEGRLRAIEPSRVLLLGGAPIDGLRHIWWNFVSSSEARIERAKRDWKEGRFGKIPGDEVEFIPLPE
jgi:redox-sensitive bicupin YhaK (pirin superfamily)